MHGARPRHQPGPRWATLGGSPWATVDNIASLCREVIILTAHERRRFVPRVDFVTRPAWLDGGDARAGLPFGGVSKVVTNLGVFGFAPDTHRMRAEALHPGVTMDAVRAHTGFDVDAVDGLDTTAPPTPEELEILRALDPERRFLG